MLTVTKGEFEAAAVVLLIDKDGLFRWSSDKTPTETANALRDIADVIEEQDS